MKIVIAGGDSKAEYIIKSFKDKKNELVVINPSVTVAERLKKACFVKVYHGEPWSRITLEQADAFDADVFISLCERDTDNYATSLMAKRMFNAKKTICVVDNPNNVEVFKKLGLDAVISSTYLLSQSIMSESSVESLTKTLSLDDNRVTVIEKVVLTKYAICYKPIKDIRFPKYASIAAIYRNYQIIIPNGSIIIEPKDTLVMVTAPNNAKSLLKYVETERVGAISRELLQPLRERVEEVSKARAKKKDPKAIEPAPKEETPSPKPSPKAAEAPVTKPVTKKETKSAEAPASKEKPAKKAKPAAKKAK